MRAIARRELGQFDEALKDHRQALRLCHTPVELAEAHDQRRETYLRLGDYGAALQDAQHCVVLQPEEFRYQFGVFAALFWAMDYEQAQAQYRHIATTSPEWHRLFSATLQKQVFDILASARDLHLPAEVALKAPFYLMQEAAACYELIAERATRLVPGGAWSCCWSPDGTQIAYARAPSYAWSWGPPLVADGFPAIGSGKGIEVLDIASGQKRLLTTFGVCPSWSPDGRLIAFSDKRYPPGAAEVWVVPAVGGRPRQVALGYQPGWSLDSRTLFFRSTADGAICQIRIDEPGLAPVHIMETPGRYPRWSAVSPSGRYLAHEYAHEVSIVELSSRSVVAQWQTPWPLFGWRLTWSPDEKHLVVGSSSWYSQTGTWVLDIEEKQAHAVLPAPADLLSIAPDGSRALLSTLDELWLVDIDAGTPLTEAFGSPMTQDEFLSDRLHEWTQRIDTDPTHAEHCSSRALVYISLDLYNQADADLTKCTGLVTSNDDPMIYAMCWWARRYCSYHLYEGGVLLGRHAAQLVERFPDAEFLAGRAWIHPARNLARLYESRGEVDLTERWRMRLPADSGD